MSAADDPRPGARRPAHRPPPTRPAPVPFSGHGLGRRASARSIAGLVFRAEVLAFLRDRRALISAVVLPIVLYPLIFFGNTWLERVSRETLAARKVTVALDLAGTPEILGDELRRLLEAQPPIDLVDFDAERLREQVAGQVAGLPDAPDAELRIARETLGEGYDLLITVLPHSVLVGRLVYRVYLDGSDELGNEAARRAGVALDSLEEREAAARRREVLGAGDPARGLDEQTVDVADAGSSGGAALGKLLPLVAMLILVSGGAYGALSAFAGERENNTLETLLVQPVPAVAVAWGKFAAVTLLAVAALLSNAGSLVASLALGLGRLPGVEEGAAAAPGLALGIGRLGLGAVVFLPAVVLICAVLCLISARARSFREGQHAIFPLTLAVALPAAAAGWADIDLDGLTALVPLLGQGLALRDAISGRLGALGAIVAFLSGWAWAWLAMRRLADTLDAERMLQGEDTEREMALRGTQSKRALAWGLAAVIAIYFVGGWLQAWRILPGLLLTLWVVAPVLALLAARGTARRAGVPLAEVLSLRRPRMAHLLGALLVAPALGTLMRAWVPWQQRLLPMPTSQVDAGGALELITSLSPLALFFVFALSPGVNEELLFRGAIQGGLVRDLSPRRVIFWQALLFAFAHASVYRFVPTAVLGAVLAGIVLRSRSLYPAIVLHVAYDALLVLSDGAPRLADGRLAWLAVPGLLLLAVRAPQRSDSAADSPENRP